MKKGIFLLSFILGCYGVLIVFQISRFGKEKVYRERIDRKIADIVEANFETQNERFKCIEKGIDHNHDMKYISTKHMKYGVDYHTFYYSGDLYQHTFRCRKCKTEMYLGTSELPLEYKEPLQKLGIIIGDEE